MTRLPELRSAIPGPASRELGARLARVECPEVTCLSSAPVFWKSASGSNVIDVDGNCFVDLLAGFGSVALGYAHEQVSDAISQTARTLPHAMGDVFPAELKVELLEALDRILPGDLGHAILSGSGSEAVESALKTAMIATGKPGVVAFEGAYHGLGLGSLDATHRADFREHFRSRLPAQTRFVPYGDAEAARAAIDDEVGAILVEPIQGRGGILLPPDGFLRALREIADETGVLLIADEVYTGLGRTGRWLACEHEGVVPDVVALGKGLGGGFPISACVGRKDVMKKWPVSKGEAIHTSTHLGNPMGCAAGLAVLKALEGESLCKRSEDLGSTAIERLRSVLAGNPAVREVRGRGLMIGIEVREASVAERVTQEMLALGWILLPEGPEANVLALTPPLTIPETILDAAIDALAERLA